MSKGKFPNGLADVMKVAGIGVTELGRLIDEPKQNVDRWKNQERKLTPEVAQKIAPHLKVTVEQLLLLPAKALPDAPLAGLVGAGGAILDISADESEHRPQIAILAEDPEGAIAVQISGESLGEFKGWYAIVKGRDAFHDALYDQLCVLETADGETLIKWIKRTRKKGVKLVSGDGSDHADGVQLKWAGRVIGIRPPR